jgi:hypothetical protein
LDGTKFSTKITLPYKELSLWKTYLAIQGSISLLCFTVHSPIIQDSGFVQLWLYSDCHPVDDQEIHMLTPAKVLLPDILQRFHGEFAFF